MRNAAILLTANEADCPLFLNRLEKKKDLLLHLPLEKYESYLEDEVAGSLPGRLEEFVFVVHGNVRNARYFLQWAEEHGLLDECKNKIHLTSDPDSSAILEKYSLPAIMPREFAKGIDIIEFMLRISKDGAVLYPTSDSHTDEIPGLLKELEMPVTEFTVCRERSISDKELKSYRNQLLTEKIGMVLFHNRSSIKRIKLAFPKLDLHQTRNVAADKGIAEKMEKENIPVHTIADGTWLSMVDVVTEHNPFDV